MSNAELLPMVGLRFFMLSFAELCCRRRICGHRCCCCCLKSSRWFKRLKFKKNKTDIRYLMLIQCGSCTGFTMLFRFYTAQKFVYRHSWCLVIGLEDYGVNVLYCLLTQLVSLASVVVDLNFLLFPLQDVVTGTTVLKLLVLNFAQPSFFFQSSHHSCR